MSVVVKSFTVQSVQSSVVQTVESDSIELMTRQEAKTRGVKFFYTGKHCNNGHLSERYVNDGKCRQCVSDRNFKRYDPEKRKEWYLNYYPENSHKVREYQAVNGDKILKDKKRYRENNRSEISKKKKKWNEANIEHVREYRVRTKEERKIFNAQYYQCNKERIAKRIKQYNRENPMGAFIRATLRRLETAKSAERIQRYEREVGYTQAEFIKHIESKFKPGMNWGNRSQWHIDHIKPLSVFLREGVTDIRIINALSNLQPLWASENLEKYNKWG